MPDPTVALVRIFQKMCSCCYISALSFFTGFKMCHKILLGQGTRQATRWLRMIYFPGFRLVKKEHRMKVSTYLWTCRIWEIKEPWNPSSTDSLVISKPVLQYPVSWPSVLDFNIFSNETRFYICLMTGQMLMSKVFLPLRHNVLPAASGPCSNIVYSSFLL